MDYLWIDEYCAKKQGVLQDYKEEWKATRFQVGGKMFAMRGGDKNGVPIFTLKLTPSFSDFLHRQYESVVPGYYMNKTHWSSLYFTGEVPETLIRQMIDEAYELVFRSLPKKIQAGILAEP